MAQAFLITAFSAPTRKQTHESTDYYYFLGLSVDSNIKSYSAAKSQRTETQTSATVKARELAVKASFIIVEKIAKACKLFTEGGFIKNCIEKVCGVVCPDKNQVFDNISLSRNTVASWVDELGSDLQIRLKDKAKDSGAYSLAVDESADGTDNAQLSILI